ncbi:TPA: hypothetical protein ACOEOF_004480, partial [Stenotrophomonas maltophilia]
RGTRLRLTQWKGLRSRAPSGNASALPSSLVLRAEIPRAEKPCAPVHINATQRCAEAKLSRLTRRAIAALAGWIHDARSRYITENGCLNISGGRPTHFFKMRRRRRI